MGKLSVCGVLAGAALLVAGCGGSDDGGDALGAAAVSVTTTIPPAEAVALAQSALLTVEELGAPWVGVPNSNYPIPFEDPACSALETSFNDPNHSASKAGIGFEIGENVGVYHDVVVVGEHEARRAMDAFQAPEAAACYTTAGESFLGPDSGAAGLSVAVNVLPLSLEAGGDEATNILTVTFTNVATGEEQVITGRDFVMVSGRAYTLFSTIGVDEATHDALMQKAKAKLDTVGAVT